MGLLSRQAQKIDGPMYQGVRGSCYFLAEAAVAMPPRKESGETAYYGLAAEE